MNHSLAKALSLIFLTAIVACSHSGEKSNNTRTEDISVMGSSSAPPLIKNMHQFTFEGLRSGEGYFSHDGELMIFQSEREKENPFYQMYLKNISNGTTKRVSPGYGKTTCGWIAPDKKSIIFSSTHLDPEAKAKQKAELDFRASGQTRRYSWDYDENYDIFRADINGGKLVNLTHTKGYDAEGSISPDGKQIAFASNRTAYDHTLNDEEKAQLAKDPSFFMEIYIMNNDGSNVRRLTNTPGYDGGPFFSPDGNRIVWRRFAPNGMTAEIYSMKTDGSDQKQLTHLNAMSWAPFYHPSGDYIIFTTSVLGHQNFELYAVDTDGQRSPVRVTYLEGFDGLPVFTPDGQKLTWNHKGPGGDSQIMIADWNDNLIRQMLGLKPALPTVRQLTSGMSEDNLRTTLKYLASKELRGRATGSAGEMEMAHTIAQYFKDLGLTAPDHKSFTQAFPFVKDAVMGSQNNLTIIGANQQSLKLNEAWRPLAFTHAGEFAATPVVFAGYGIRAPSDKGNPAYDSYAGLDVKDKWVMILRYSPENITATRKLFLQSYSHLEHKAVLARDLGARGVIFVSGPNAHAKDELIPFKRATGSDIGIAALSVSDAAANSFLKLAQKDLNTLQTDLDAEKMTAGFEIQNLKISASLDVHMLAGEGHNTIGFMMVPGASETLMIGAHGDHLGDEASDHSLMNSNDKDPIHYGADDNASGVSAVLELAHYFSTLKKSNPGQLKQNILFAVWSGEELGDLGSSYFAKGLKKLRLKPSAYINMDMIGRWKNDPKTGTLEPLLIQGVGSSDRWRELIESLKLEIPVQLQNDPYLPTDSMAIYMAQIPAISFFTGVHLDYHTPRDTEDKINYPGLLTVTKTVAALAEKVASQSEALPYKAAPKSSQDNKRGFRIFLGTIPDYTQENVKGVKLSGVVSGGPAEKAGLHGGDVVVEFASHRIENMHDYVFTMETVRPNEPTKIVVLREGKRAELSITPLAKE